MESSYDTLSNGYSGDPGRQIVRHSSYQSSNRSSLPWFDIRVFYVRISHFVVDDSTPEYLTLNHVPLSHDSLLEVNGARFPVYSDAAPCLLRRDRVDRKSEEATFVSTDSIRFTGDLKFEVSDKEDLVLSGVLEMLHSNGFVGESKNNNARGWYMNCEPVMSAGTGFLKGKHINGSEISSPTVEVYIAGCYSGTPIILTKTLQLSHRKKHQRKAMLDSIPEQENTDSQPDGASGLDLQIVDHVNYKEEDEEDYSSLYWGRSEYLEDEDGELSWFNAGVRVGVGIGLGICVGVGIGVGLLVRTYHATTGTFRRRLL